MQNLELLVEGTYQQLLELADNAQRSQEALGFQRARLAAATRLLHLLLKLRFGLTAEDVASLEAHLSPLVEETVDQGWEERTDAAVTHLLKTALAKDRDAHKEGGGGRSSAHGALARPPNAEKLKKHITLVADRLNKGLRPGRDPVVATGGGGGGGGGGGAARRRRGWSSRRRCDEVGDVHRAHARSCAASAWRGAALE